MTADEVKAKLRLTPHPREGGWFVQTYAAAECFRDERYDSPRPTSTAIYYLLEPETFSEMHRLKSDEVFHFYAGDAVEMLQLAHGEPGQRVLIGSDLSGEARPQVLVPRGVWQGARLVAGGRWALLGCTVSPGFAYEDYEGGRWSELSAGWPEWSEMIRALTRE
ncbi:cupin domain-containing protein [Granulicella sp. WH15]|uniref:cupin domain-containing protein n=1 Tax=Granulicella sp. WH15 TaxID=2602070 RepID=UPI0013668111|nr:cupin domain-containing protein [Granulicella sp. WH15]QHN02973.1 cupin domain-containing protein [Granulicella sp. WH15]